MLEYGRDLISGLLTEVIDCDLKWRCMDVHEPQYANLFVVFPWPHEKFQRPGNITLVYQQSG